jgi:outer membrane protein assembly factor BamB
MNCVLKGFLNRSPLIATGLLITCSLIACSSSEKDYSDATPLSTIDTRIEVIPLWAKATGDVPKSAHAQLPVTFDDGRLYLATRRGVVEVLDAQTGKQYWRVALGEALSGGPGVGAKQLFVATRKAKLIALDKTTGVEQWHQRISSEMLATPVVVNGQLVVQTIDEKISLYDTATGKKVWDYARTVPKLTLRGTSAPLVVGDKILAGFSDGSLVALNLATGELLWETAVAAPHGRTELERLVDIDGLFAAANGIVYVSSFQGRVAAVSISDGNILWARDMSSYTGLAISANHVFVTDAESKVWALDGRTGATLWRQDKLKGRELSTPAVVGNMVVVADYDGYVHWLSAEDGQFMARESLDAIWRKLNYVWEDEEDETARRSVSVLPLAVDGTVYVRDNVGALTAFQLKH